MSAFCSLSSPMLQDLFKGFARHLSHLLTQEQSPARRTGVSGVISVPDVFMALEGADVLSVNSKGGVSSLAVKEEAQRLIKEFFKTRLRCESETDWEELQSSES